MGKDLHSLQQLLVRVLHGAQRPLVRLLLRLEAPLTLLLMGLELVSVQFLNMWKEGCLPASPTLFLSLGPLPPHK